MLTLANLTAALASADRLQTAWLVGEMMAEGVEHGAEIAKDGAVARWTQA